MDEAIGGRVVTASTIPQSAIPQGVTK